MILHILAGRAAYTDCKSHAQAEMIKMGCATRCVDNLLERLINLTFHQERILWQVSVLVVSEKDYNEFFWDDFQRNSSFL
jgi:hypothetical protein